MKNFIKHLVTIIIPLAVISLFYGSVMLFPQSPNGLSDKSRRQVKVLYLYSKVKDTIYLLSDNYVTISLQSQTAHIHNRHGKDFSFPISSGNGRINGGMNTPTGLFSVQSKTPIALSKQFGNCELTDWVGFNGNIGFHGLKGSGYYGNLGRRPSSHGCVRMSHEAGKELYARIKRGTPVMVYDEDPAITLKFADSTDFQCGNDLLILQKDRATDLMLQNRIKGLSTGYYYHYADKKIFLDGTAIIRNRGFRIGTSANIASYQLLPPIVYENPAVSTDATANFVKPSPQSKDKQKMHDSAQNSAEQTSTN